MTEQQKLESIKDAYRRFGKNELSMLDIILVVKAVVEIDDTISPLQHQDGASAEDVVKATIMGHVDPNKVAKISGELMRVFQSETAKVVAAKDLIIKEREEECMSLSYDLEKMTNAWTVSHKTAVRRREKIDVLQSELSTSNAHRTRLIESVIKWGGAWRTCRAELKEAKLRIAELEEINMTQATWLMEAVMTEPEQKEWVEQHKIL